MTWGGNGCGLPQDARQELAVRHAHLVRNLAVTTIREGAAPRSHLSRLVGVGTQALVAALQSTHVPTGPGFERYARSQIRRAMDNYAVTQRLAA